jgi:hypothetical protein
LEAFWLKNAAEISSISSAWFRALMFKVDWLLVVGVVLAPVPVPWLGVVAVLGVVPVPVPVPVAAGVWPVVVPAPVPDDVPVVVGGDVAPAPAAVPPVPATCSGIGLLTTFPDAVTTIRVGLGPRN